LPGKQKIHMALIDCANPAEPLPVAAVTKNTPWQTRLRAAALNQKELASMLGIAENTVSRQMKGDWPVAGYVEAFVEAWELMTPAQRAEWRAKRQG
jgi:hypothetical protein